MILNLDQLEQLAAEWKRLQPLEPTREAKLWLKLRLEWNYNSNHLEGNTLTYSETELLLLHDQTTGTHTLREYEEMKGHDLAIAVARGLAADAREITEADVRNLNQILLKEPFYKKAVTETGEPTRKKITPGQYKESPNSVRTATGEMFHYAEPLDVPPRMMKLVETIRNSATKEGLTFLAALAMTHHEFTLIHPFDDGNGRTARLLTNYMLLRKGLPPLVIPSNEKEKYLAALRLADGGDPAALTDFFSEKLLWSLKLGIKAAKGESVEEPSDIEKEIELFVREQDRNRITPTKRTTEDVRKVWEGSLKPLLLKLEEKTQEIGKLFSSRKITLSIDNEYSNLVLSTGLAVVTSEVRYVKKIRVLLKLEGYLASSKYAFSLSKAIDIEFGDYTYHFIVGVIDGTTRPYSMILSQDEIDEFISSYLKTLFKEIKEKSEVASY